MKHESRDNHVDDRIRVVPVLMGVVLLVVSGLAYRMLAGNLERLGEVVPMPKGTLGRLPLQIGEWSGVEVPLSEAIVKRTDTDDHLNRRYVRSEGGPWVAVFIGYGVRARDLMPHRPDVCYPGAGWVLRDKHVSDLKLADGRVLKCQVFSFSRGGLDAGRMTVVNYYVVDGEYSPDISLLRSKAWRGARAVRYVSQVQIMAFDDTVGSQGSGFEAAAAFAVDSAGEIRKLLPGADSAGDGTTTRPVPSQGAKS